MDLFLNEEQEVIQKMARKFAQNELMPVSEKLDRGDDSGVLLTNLKKLAELGFMGLNIEADFDGSQAGSIAFSVALTELARGCASTAVTTSVTNMVAEVIQSVGSEA